MINGMPYELFLLRVPVILLALTIHEVAHGWEALRRGDPTARDAGRITLNPIPHLDLLGTLMLMTGLFGWAKPVPVNTYYLRNPKRDLVFISLAGPVSNIIMAVIFGLVIRVIDTVDPHFFYDGANRLLLTFLELGFYINCGIAFFNLLPIPPLDGSKILAGALPDKYIPGYFNAAKYALPIIFGLVILSSFMRGSIFSAVLGAVFLPIMLLIKWLALFIIGPGSLL